MGSLGDSGFQFDGLVVLNCFGLIFVVLVLVQASNSGSTGRSRRRGCGSGGVR